MKNNLSFVSLLALFAFCLFGMIGSSASAQAQAAAKGSVKFIVKDSSGAVVPDARVQVFVMSIGPAGNSYSPEQVNENQPEQLQARRVIKTVTTDKDGIALVENIEARRYAVEASAVNIGFAKSRINVEAGKTIDVNLVLTKR